MLNDGNSAVTYDKSLKETESYISVFWVLKVQIYYKSFNFSSFSSRYCNFGESNLFRNSFMKMEAV